jgi:signal transduction histidine kinase
MSKLTRQLLDFYRTSFVSDEMRLLGINSILQDVIRSFGDELGRSNIQLIAELGSDLPLVRGSGDKLKQVFLNIVLNARDAMPDGGVIRVVTATEDGHVKVSISDTGVGIPKENLGKIFDAFFTTKSKVSGVGLGLSVSYGIVSQHRGTIAVSSTVGEGSTFVVSIPVQMQEESVRQA